MAPLSWSAQAPIESWPLLAPRCCEIDGLPRDRPAELAHPRILRPSTFPRTIGRPMLRKRVQPILRGRSLPSLWSLVRTGRVGWVPRDRVKLIALSLTQIGRFSAAVNAAAQWDRFPGGRFRPPIWLRFTEHRHQGRDRCGDLMRFRSPAAYPPPPAHSLFPSRLSGSPGNGPTSGWCCTSSSHA